LFSRLVQLAENGKRCATGFAETELAEVEDGGNNEW